MSIYTINRSIESRQVWNSTNKLNPRNTLNAWSLTYIIRIFLDTPDRPHRCVGSTDSKLRNADASKVSKRIHKIIGSVLFIETPRGSHNSELCSTLNDCSDLWIIIWSIICKITAINNSDNASAD